MIAGFEDPDAGQVLVANEEITDLPPHRRNIGVVFQQYALFPHLTVAQNVAYPLEMRRQGRAEIRSRVSAALDLVRLQGLEGRYPRQLSGGQQQRVALARAIVFEPPVFVDVGGFEDDEPEIFVQPDGQPASVAAVDSVNEAGLPTRNGGEPAGSGESADGNSSDNDDTSETTTGVILIDAKDDPSVVTINGTAVTSVGQVIAGAHGNLTITSISDTVIGYTYTLTDNTSGNDTHDDFLVTVTDNDGDQASATLTIDIVDDVPTARPDTDSIASGQYGPVTGNVITDASAGDAGDSDAGADTVEKHLSVHGRFLSVDHLRIVAAEHERQSRASITKS